MAAQKEEKYNRILQAAMEVILEKGMSKASVSDVVKKADVAKGTFYLYFESKSSLIPAIAEYLLNMNLNNILSKVEDEHHAIEETVETMIEETFQMTKTYKNIIVLCYSGLAFDHSFDKWEQIYRPYYEWFQSKLEKAMDEQTILKVAHASSLSKTIINLIEQSAERYYFSEEGLIPIDTTKQELSAFIYRAIGYKK